MNTIKSFIVIAACLAGTACSVEKTQDAKLPSVDVTVTKGKLPAYNIQTPTVEVGSKNTTVQVPTVKVVTPNEKNKEAVAG